MLQVCLNGNRRADAALGLPVTPEDLARDARACLDAGADELHIHPRGPNGAESLAPADVAAALRAVRRAVPGMPVGISTGDWIAPGGRARHALMADWEELPDYVSVNLSEPDADEVIALMGRMRIGVEAGLASTADARRYLALAPSLPAALRVMIEMEADPAAAETEALAIVDLLPADGPVPLLLHGQEESLWPMVEMVARLGLDTRVGLEDGLLLPDGRPAGGNAEMVRAAGAWFPRG